MSYSQNLEPEIVKSLIKLPLYGAHGTSGPVGCSESFLVLSPLSLSHVTKMSQFRESRFFTFR